MGKGLQALLKFFNLIWPASTFSHFRPPFSTGAKQPSARLFQATCVRQSGAKKPLSGSLKAVAANGLFGMVVVMPFAAAVVPRGFGAAVAPQAAAGFAGVLLGFGVARVVGFILPAAGDAAVVPGVAVCQLGEIDIAAGQADAGDFAAVLVGIEKLVL